MTPLSFEGIGMTSRRTRQRLIDQLRDMGIVDERVLDILFQLPRHLFVDEALAHRAYENTALPIGYKQTISQPYIVAKMTETLLSSMKTTGRLLEVGTGSGYQAAVISQLVQSVYSVERIKPLQERARAILSTLKIRNVHFKYSDGSLGWPEKAPFDGIISTAAPKTIPLELLQQLGPDGVLVIPVGDQEQSLQIVKREGDSDQFHREVLEPVRFVPLVSGSTFK